MYGNQRYDPEPFPLNAPTPEPFGYDSERVPNSASNLMDGGSAITFPHHQHSNSASSSSAITNSVVQTARSSKSGYRDQPRRYVMHTDAADAIPEPEPEPIKASPNVVVQFVSEDDGAQLAPAVSLPANVSRDDLQSLVNSLSKNVREYETPRRYKL